MDIDKELDRVCDIAKAKNSMVYNIYCVSYGTDNYRVFRLYYYGGRSDVFKTWQGLVDHVDNMPKRNEILFRKF